MVLRRYRFAASPRWVGGHVIVLALAVTMVLLGRWQLDVSNAKHFDLQNFGYALQWWAFTAFGLVMWAKILRDAARRHAGEEASPDETRARAVAAARARRVEPVPYRRYLMPQSRDAIAPAGDSTLAAYNDYLSRLAREDDG
jgi:DNA-binding transcriptional regulator of glucitol operon